MLGGQIMSGYSTEQEDFWAGDFGEEYIGRNSSDLMLASNLAFFGEIFKKVHAVNSILELGCNVGMNLKAIQHLAPNCSISGIDINKKAIEKLSAQKPEFNLKHASINQEIKMKSDLCFTKGVLIHINPVYLDKVYQNLYNNSSKYILIAEYYNPTPVSVPYRDNTDKLFKRDFAGEILDKYQDLKLVDYGFSYHRDLNFPQDDMCWFLLKKSK